MGMAPYGRPNRVADVYKLIKVGADVGFHLNMNYFSFHHSTSRTFNENFVNLFGQPRIHDSTFYTQTTHPNKDHPDWDNSTAIINQHYADIAASIQRATETIILKMVNHVYRETNRKKLCMAGGVALNCVANGRILREGPFEDI